jgi:voltage-gated potassium channel
MQSTVIAASEPEIEGAAYPDRSLRSPGYQLFMLVLCVYALGALAAQTAVRLTPETQDVLEYADLAVCGLFFVDFLHSLVSAPNRWQYLKTWGWLDLISSLPAVAATRWGRAARILRILRVLRGLRATKVFATLILRRRSESAFLAASLTALLLVVFGSIAVLIFETHPESNIKTAEDAIWWAFSSIMTTGYGDHFPVTSEGRFVAAILMCAGIGLFGTFSGFLAAWFIGSKESDGDPRLAAEIAALRADVDRIRRLIEAKSEIGPNAAI